MLDLIGYVAGTTHRGVRHIRIPTTVLAQNDSGVGVKNGVNAFGVKNLLGTFAPPFAVLNDIEFLPALEPRDRIAGMAEAVKVALIRDAVFFGWLEAHADELAAFQPQATAYMIRRCAELHMRQIAHGGDPFETGSACPLDYGHWAAHKLEILTHHALRHGEAVAIGLALDSRYSVQVGRLKGGEAPRLPTPPPTPSSRTRSPSIVCGGPARNSATGHRLDEGVLRRPRPLPRRRLRQLPRR
jgi:3-dehydroquinate synthase